MGYGQSTINILRDIYNDAIFKTISSVMELGSQDIKTNQNELDNFFSELNLDTKIILDNDRVSTKFLYEALGVNKYTCIDIDEAHSSLNFDLNEDILQKYNFCEQFDLVTNHGTTEHIFNQFAGFKNIHNLCKNGGYMQHILPIHKMLFHCMFNYQPYTFFSLARFNSYKIIKIELIDNHTQEIYEYNHNNFIKLHKTNLEDLQFTEGILLHIMFQKTNDNEFVIPIQANESYYPQIQKDILKTFIRYNPKSVAVFGAGISGKKVIDWCNYLGIKVECIIDDFQQGTYNGIDIVSWENFLPIEDRVEFIFRHCYQGGNILQKNGLNKKVIDILDCFM